MVLRFARARAPLKTNRFHVDSVAGAGFLGPRKKRQQRDKGGLHTHNYTLFFIKSFQGSKELPIMIHQARFKRGATSVSNSNEFDPEVARQ